VQATSPISVLNTFSDDPKLDDSKVVDLSLRPVTLRSLSGIAFIHCDSPTSDLQDSKDEGNNISQVKIMHSTDYGEVFCQSYQVGFSQRPPDKTINFENDDGPSSALLKMMCSADNKLHASYAGRFHGPHHKNVSKFYQKLINEDLKKFRSEKDFETTMRPRSSEAKGKEAFAEGVGPADQFILDYAGSAVVCGSFFQLIKKKEGEIKAGPLAEVLLDWKKEDHSIVEEDTSDCASQSYLVERRASPTTTVQSKEIARLQKIKRTTIRKDRRPAGF
jgi:hypothetical protein